MAKINIKEKAAAFAVKAEEVAGEVASKAGETVGKAGAAIVEVKTSAAQKIEDLRDNIPQISVEDVLYAVMKVPLVKIDRRKFLHKELIKYFPEDTVQLAIDKNPAYAGVDRETINKISKQVINFETNKVTTVSFAAGLPGGFAMAATIPADVVQYFTFILRAMQKLAYLYGFQEFEFSEDEVSDETMNHMLIFMGVMFGVQGANQGVKIVAEKAAQKLTKTLAQKALTKGAVYPIVKKIATKVGLTMTKQVFAESVGKVVPVLGGVVAGTLTYASFKPGCLKLRNSFKEFKLSDPEFYKHPTKEDETIIDISFEDAEFTDI